MDDHKPYQRSYKRRQKSKKPLTRLYDNDLDEQILFKLTQYHYLTAELLSGIVGSSRQYLSRRLCKLAQHDLIAQYNDAYNSLPLMWPDFYYITKKGEDYLVKKGYERSAFLSHLKKAEGETAQNFEHDFQACRVMASIETAISQLNGYYFLHRHDILRGKPMTLPCHVSHRFENGKRTAYDDNHKPDQIFGWIMPDGKKTYFTLEQERENPVEPSDLRRSSPLKKVVSLRDIHAKKTYEKQWGISNLRTLFTLKNNDRTLKAVDMTDRVIGETNAFLFTTTNIRECGLITDIVDRHWLQAGYSPTKLV